MAADWILAALLAAPQSEVHVDRIGELDQLISQLLDLQQRVRGGEVVPLRELELGAPTREEVLAQIDVRGATRLGVEPATVRERLLPGFDAELERLVAQRDHVAAGPPPGSSPLLQLLLDFELELKANADRRRSGLGLQNPLDHSSIASPLQPRGAPGPAVVDGVDVTGAVARGIDPLLAAAALYRAGRWQEALDAWSRVTDPATIAPESRHQRADALLRLGRVDEAIAIWERVATDEATTPWGQQAGFSLRVARALAALQEAKKSQAGEKAAAPSGGQR